MEIINLTKNKTEETKTSPTTVRRVAAYARVSTNMDAQEDSFESQVAYYKHFISNCPGYELVEVFGDEGISGLRCTERPEFQRMLTACREGKIDLIYCKSISRFSRNASECAPILRELKGCGTEVIFEKEGISSFDKNLDLVLNILMNMAQEESHSISQNIRQAYQMNAGLGKPTKRCPYGYFKVKGKEHLWKINEEEALRVRKLFDLAKTEKNTSELAKQMNLFEKELGGDKVWKKDTVSYILSNESYKGDVLTSKYVTADYINRKIVKNHGLAPQVYIEEHHEPIISPALFDKIQTRNERTAV